MSTVASAARTDHPAELPDTLIEVAFRPPCETVRATMAGYTAAQAAAVVVDFLKRPARELTALTDGDRPDLCWITRGPDGDRLARLAGASADDLNLAFAALDAAAFSGS